MTPQLFERNFENRRSVAEIMLRILNEVTVLRMSDEAHFYISGYVNKQHLRYWKSENLQVMSAFCARWNDFV